MKEGLLDAKQCRNALATLVNINSVFGVMDFEEKTLSPKAAQLIAKRETQREEKQWDRADALRNELLAMGIEIFDTPDGTVWSEKK